MPVSGAEQACHVDVTAWHVGMLPTKWVWRMQTETILQYCTGQVESRGSALVLIFFF